MEQLFLPLELTLSIQNLTRFHRYEDIMFWTNDNELSMSLLQLPEKQIKAITWEQGFDCLLLEIEKELDIFDIHIEMYAFQVIKLMQKKTVHSEYFEELAKGKENCFYALLEILKLA